MYSSVLSHREKKINYSKLFKHQKHNLYVKKTIVLPPQNAIYVPEPEPLAPAPPPPLVSLNMGLTQNEKKLPSSTNISLMPLNISHETTQCNEAVEPPQKNEITSITKNYSLKELIDIVSLKYCIQSKIPNIFYLENINSCSCGGAEKKIYSYEGAKNLILTHFREPVLYAFESCPEKYKILLWKFCAIYYYGGATINELCAADIDYGVEFTGAGAGATRDSINKNFILSCAKNPEIENLINEIVSAVKNNVSFCGWGADSAASPPTEYKSNDVSYKKNVIPLHVYQTWCTKEMPPGMTEAINVLREQNPEFEFHLYDDAECRAFIAQYFPAEVVWAFDSLRPGAYKADLWRYCILYIHGGVYLDCKYVGINGFKFIDYVYGEYLTMDCDGENIYNAFMICRAGNKILLECIFQIIKHVRARFYGKNSLYITGPVMLKKIYEKYAGDDILFFKHDFHEGPEEAGSLGKINIDIRTEGKPIMGVYPTYREEQKKYNSLPHYSDIWDAGEVYQIVPPPMGSGGGAGSWDAIKPEYVSAAATAAACAKTTTGDDTEHHSTIEKKRGPQDNMNWLPPVYRNGGGK
jgi:hypothetical protein